MLLNNILKSRSHIYIYICTLYIYIYIFIISRNIYVCYFVVQHTDVNKKIVHIR